MEAAFDKRQESPLRASKRAHVETGLASPGTEWHSDTYISDAETLEEELLEVIRRAWRPSSPPMTQVGPDYDVLLNARGPPSTCPSPPEYAAIRIGREQDPFLTKDTPSTTSRDVGPVSLDEAVFVRRRMLERPLTVRSKPARCSLSIRIPGCAMRQIINVEVVPVVCKRLKVTQSSIGFMKVYELPQTRLTARRRRQRQTASPESHVCTVDDIIVESAAMPESVPVEEFSDSLPEPLTPPEEVDSLPGPLTPADEVTDTEPSTSQDDQDSCRFDNFRLVEKVPVNLARGTKRNSFNSQGEHFTVV